MKTHKLNAVQIGVVVAVMTLLSKFIGFIREMIIANYYGTGYITDAYVMAQSIPGILFGGILGAVATAHVPLYSKTVEKQGEEVGNRFTSSVMNILLIASAVSALIGLFFSNHLVSIFARGFRGETAELTSFYLKVTFIYVLFSSLIGIMDDYLQYKGKFIIPVFSGYFYNAGVIAVVIFSAYTSHYYLVFGILLGYILRLVVELFFAKRNGFRYYLNLNTNNAVKQIAKLSIPVFIGSTAGQVALFINKTLASGLPEGSVAALNYSSLLTGMISGITTGILTTMTYPKLAQAASLEDYNRLNKLMGLGVTLSALIMIPCTLGSMVYSNQIVQIIYERGAFDNTSTQMTAIAFFYYAITLFFSAFNGLIVRCFYSMHNTRVPLYIGMALVPIDIVLNLLLIKPLGHGGLALATAVGTILNSGFLYIFLRRYYPKVTIVGSKKKVLKIIIASIAAVGISWAIYTGMVYQMQVDVYTRILQFGVAVCVAGVIYYTVLKILKVEEIDLIKQMIVRRQKTNH